MCLCVCVCASASAKGAVVNMVARYTAHSPHRMEDLHASVYVFESVCTYTHNAHVLRLAHVCVPACVHVCVCVCVNVCITQFGHNQTSFSCLELARAALCT